MERKKPAPRTPAKKKPPTKRTTKTRPKARPKKAVAPSLPRRAIFIDVENTSSETDLLKVLDHLAVDRTKYATELTAVGNWKSVGTRVGRMLAGLGAHLVHSAPAPGVRDWSDLWIAVAAGRWLATAGPGDALDLVSDDRAFDAVGDAAAAAGVLFRRTSYRAIPGVAHLPVAEEPTTHRRRRRGRSRRGQHVDRVPIAAEHGAAPAVVPAPTHHRPSTHRAASDDEAHAASHEQIRAALERLSGAGARWVSLDALSNALKAEGFTRPPGSPRLVVRLRRMKDVEVTPNGMVRLTGGTAPEAAETPPPAPPPRRRSRRRGGRGRGRSAPKESEAAPVPEDRSTDVSTTP